MLATCKLAFPSFGLFSCVQLRRYVVRRRGAVDVSLQVRAFEVVVSLPMADVATGTAAAQKLAKKMEIGLELTDFGQRLAVGQFARETTAKLTEANERLTAIEARLK